MTGAVWTTVTPLVGVLVGGAISLLSQRLVERSASNRHATMILEARRTERLAQLNAFIEAAQKAERLALHLHGPNPNADVSNERIEVILDQLWVNLRAVQLLCPEEVSQAARVLAGQAHDAVRQGTGDQSITEFLRPSRMNLIALARIDLARL